MARPSDVGIARFHALTPKTSWVIMEVDGEDAWFKIEVLGGFLTSQIESTATAILLEALKVRNLMGMFCGQYWPRTLYFLPNQHVHLDIDIYYVATAGQTIPADPMDLLQQYEIRIPRNMLVCGYYVETNPLVTVVFDEQEITRNRFDANHYSRYIESLEIRVLQGEEATTAT